MFPYLFCIPYIPPMSFRYCLDCFILRGRGSNQVLQRIQLRDTPYQKDMIAIPSTVAGTWRVLQREFSITEQRTVRKFHLWVRYTPLVLENSEQPGVFHRIVYLMELLPPRRGGLEVPTGCVLEGGALQVFNRFVREGRMDWITPDGVDTLPIQRASFDISYTFSSNLIRTVPVSSIRPEVRPDVQRPQIIPLKPFVARVIAEAVRSKGEDCPISLDSMATCRKLYVPTCGHVCSDSGCLRLDKCPVCRDATAWTPVEFVC